MVKVKIKGKTVKIASHCVICKRIRVVIRNKKGMKFADIKVDELPEIAISLVGGVICGKCGPKNRE